MENLKDIKIQLDKQGRDIEQIKNGVLGNRLLNIPGVLPVLDDHEERIVKAENTLIVHGNSIGAISNDIDTLKKSNWVTRTVYAGSGAAVGYAAKTPFVKSFFVGIFMAIKEYYKANP